MRTFLLGLIATAAVLIPAGPSQAAEPCSVGVGLDSANATCQWAYSDYSSSSISDEAHTWVVNIQCGNGGICTEYVECVEGEASGFMHDVYMDGTDVGDVCVPDEAVDEASVLTIITRQFKRIAWPASDLKVQPPDGETLVNLETIFFTDNASASVRDLRLVGREVTIEATPTSYAWSFGDGTTETTTSPGRAYPDHDVVHVYASTGTVEASVDTTYTGRFRIGAGAWQPIADTLTVEGASEELDILEAKPQLVIR